jgi:hypothetical protein
VLFLAGLSMHPHELEVILDINSTFYVTKERSFVSSYTTNIGFYMDICNDKTLKGVVDKVEMTELVLI